MSDNHGPEQRFPVRLTKAQRIVVAEMFSELSERLRLDEPDQRLVSLSLNEMMAIHQKARQSVGRSDSGMKRNSLMHVADLTMETFERFQGIGRITLKDRIYQLRIALKDLKPVIWRRIQVRECTLDKLHEHIQTAMGWTNSHLHHFQINDELYGDPQLMEEDFDGMGYADSRVTTLSKVLPKSGARFPFEYLYDFGDSWLHEVLFEGCLKANPGQRYPLCLEGERACPPEDVGGTSGFEDFVMAIADPEHPEREENLTWAGGSFDPETFDPERTTKRMIRGLPSWRESA
jgi:hypothetical protein